MTRLGWVILGLIVAGLAAFLSMTSFGGGGGRVSIAVPPAADGSAPPEDVASRPLGMLAVPVAGVPRSAIRDNWGEARGGGARSHHGTDIAAPAGTPVVAAAPGVVEKLFQSQLGGTTVYVRSPDRGTVYYYAHLAGYAPGLHEGQAVRAGERIAFVGDTGDAGPGNYHLHFGLQRTRPDERWYQGEDINPYPMLAARRPAS
jgi:murein DD-endopeptidase MepM/ murein hydrolase activator NlpD